jgi:protein-S-isoprenylcysteine O-methyltransferase Ste14
MKIKLLPPVLVVILLVLMAAANRWWPAPAWLPSAARAWSLVPIAAGVALLVIARVQFARQRTNIYTFDEPGALVTDGVFAISRHPMYLGFALVLLGAAIGFGSVAALLIALAYLPLADRFYVAFEERWLQRKFGQDYADYRRRVRRWL